MPRGPGETRPPNETRARDYMTEQLNARLLARRFSIARNPFARWWLNLHVGLQRLRAHWLALEPELTKRSCDVALSLALLALLSPLFLLDPYHQLNQWIL